MRSIISCTALAFGACLPAPRVSALNPDAGTAPTDFHDGEGLRLMSLNIAHGGGLAWHPILVHQDDFAPNLDVAAALLARERPHVVALQEVDAKGPWTGNVNHLDYIGERAGYPHGHLGIHVVLSVFGPKLSAGTALLSRLPLAGAANHNFRTGSDDLQGYVRARVPFPGASGVEVDVLSLHLHPGSRDVREQQVQQIIDHFSPRQRPLIVMGDFNCPWSGESLCIGRLSGALGMHVFEPEAHMPTYSALNPKLRLDWIAVSDDLEFVSYRHLEDLVSDHLPLLATVRLL